MKLPTRSNDDHAKALVLRTNDVARKFALI